MAYSPGEGFHTTIEEVAPHRYGVRLDQAQGGRSWRAEVDGIDQAVEMARRMLIDRRDAEAEPMVHEYSITSRYDAHSDPSLDIGQGSLCLLRDGVAVLRFSTRSSDVIVAAAALLSWEITGNPEALGASWHKGPGEAGDVIDLDQPFEGGSVGDALVQSVLKRQAASRGAAL